MHKIWTLILFMFSLGTLAQEKFVLETNPHTPVRGEVFQILFKCRAEGNTQPEIDFTPVGFEVLGKQIQGVSTRTTYINGKYSTTRELLVSYDARAPRAGIIYLNNVVVSLDGKTEREASVPIQVVDAPPEPRYVFIAAEVSKKTAFVGEGIMVRYHIYTKTALQSSDMKKYPKLDGFMKRFLQENENPQRVTVDGDLYRKSILYSVRVYPEKAGKLTIDPMEVSVTYAQDVYGNMGFGFGLGMRDLKTKTLQSEPVQINVTALPEAGKPASFSGLVGEHKFELKTGREQLLVNEPTEIRLSISGPGALEAMEPPSLWEVTELEKFDSKADLNLVGPEESIKVFDYTYLGKKAGTVPARKLELSYFDPASQRYVKVEKDLPSIVVAGNAATAPERPEKSQEDISRPAPLKKSDSPVFVTQASWWNSPPILWVLVVIVVVGGLVGRHSFWKESAQGFWRHDPELARLASSDLGSADLVRVLFRLSPTSPDARHALKSSTLSDDSKQYFSVLLDELEASEFKGKGKAQTTRLSPEKFKELKRALKT